MSFAGTEGAFVSTGSPQLSLLPSLNLKPGTASGAAGPGPGELQPREFPDCTPSPTPRDPQPSRGSCGLRCRTGRLHGRRPAMSRGASFLPFLFTEDFILHCGQLIKLL